MTCGPGATVWARPIVFTGKRANLVKPVSSGLHTGTTLNVKPLGPVWLYKDRGVLAHAQRFSKE